METLCIVGLGYIGLPTSLAFVHAGYKVIGIDIKPDTIKTLNAGLVSIEEAGLQEYFDQGFATGHLTFSERMHPADVFIITVQTPYRKTADGGFIADTSYVESAIRSIAGVYKPGNLIILESTIPPHTTQKMVNILREAACLPPDAEVNIAHCPERVTPGRIIQELATNNRIIGSVDRRTAERAAALYEKTLTTGKIYITDDVTAEMCKLVENTYRDINIAYANELSLVCDDLGINVFELIEMANLHPRVHILDPGVGVGGHCIAVDPWFICEASPNNTHLIAVARSVNNMKPSYIADKLCQCLGTESKEICVLGLAYKADVDDLRESPSIELAHLLQEKGYRVTACEPYVKDTWIQGIENIPLDVALDGTRFLVITLKHKQFADAIERIKNIDAMDVVGLLPWEAQYEEGNGSVRYAS